MPRVVLPPTLCPVTWTAPRVLPPRLCPTAWTAPVLGPPLRCPAAWGRRSPGPGRLCPAAWGARAAGPPRLCPAAWRTRTPASLAACRAWWDAETGLTAPCAGCVCPCPCADWVRELCVSLAGAPAADNGPPPLGGQTADPNFGPAPLAPNLTFRQWEWVESGDTVLAAAAECRRSDQPFPGGLAVTPAPPRGVVLLTFTALQGTPEVFAAATAYGVWEVPDCTALAPGATFAVPVAAAIRRTRRFGEPAVDDTATVSGEFTLAFGPCEAGRGFFADSTEEDASGTGEMADNDADQMGGQPRPALRTALTVRPADPLACPHRGAKLADAAGCCVDGGSQWQCEHEDVRRNAHGGRVTLKPQPGVVLDACSECDHLPANRGRGP